MRRRGHKIKATTCVGDVLPKCSTRPSLLPADAMAALDVRFLDRFFDLHVMDPVQLAVASALQRLAMKREEGLAITSERLERACAWLEGHLAGKAWAAGADCTLGAPDRD